MKNTTTPTRYRLVDTVLGAVAVYAAELSDHDGATFWQAGSASGCVPSHWRAEEVKPGDTFTHWMHGEVSVKRVNAKSLTLAIAGGETIRMEL